MGLLSLVVILGVAAVHALKTKARTSQRWTELFLVYLLVGYCGLFVFGISIFGLVDGEHLAKTFGFSTGGPFMQFLCFTFLGMSTIAILSIWFRGQYLIAPTVCWSIFWLGATYVHLANAFAAKGYLTFHFFLIVFFSHGIVAVLLLGLLWASYSTAGRQKNFTGR